MAKIIMVVVSALLLLGVAAACSTDTEDLEDRIAALEQASTGDDGGTETAQIASMLLAVDILGTVGLHDLDVAANEENEVVAGAAGSVNRAVLALAAADWPAELQTIADDLLATLQELAAALGADEPDPAAVGPPATAAHDAQHDFEHEVSAYISAQVGLPVEEEEGDHGDGEETPAEGEETHEEGEEAEATP